MQTLVLLLAIGSSALQATHLPNLTVTFPHDSIPGEIVQAKTSDNALRYLQVPDEGLEIDNDVVAAMEVSNSGRLARVHPACSTTMFFNYINTLSLTLPLSLSLLGNKRYAGLDAG